MVSSFLLLYLGIYNEDSTFLTPWICICNWQFSIFGSMHEFWTILATNVTYTRSQNYTNMMVGKHGIQTFKVMVVVLLFFLLLFIYLLVPTSVQPLLI